MTALIAFFNAIAALPKIGEYFEKFAALLTGWYIGNVKASERQLIMDSVAFTLHAESKEDRQKALDMWKEVMSKKRVIS